MSEEKDLTLQTKWGKFNHRVVFLAFEEGKVLLQYASTKGWSDEDYWFAPGGRVAFGEDTADTVVREIEEELHLENMPTEFAGVVENFFEIKGEPYHEISVYYRTQLPKGFEPKTEEQNGKSITLAWCALGDLQNMDVRPAFLKKHIAKFMQGSHHHIHREY